MILATVIFDYFRDWHLLKWLWRALLAAREAEDSGYIRSALPWDVTVIVINITLGTIASSLYFQYLGCALKDWILIEKKGTHLWLEHRAMEKRRQQAFSAWAGHQFSIYKLKNLQFTNKQVSNIKFTPIIREHIFAPVPQNLFLHFLLNHLFLKCPFRQTRGKVASFQ